MIKNTELKTILSRLHTVVKSMFEVDEQEQISIGLTESGDFEVTIDNQIRQIRLSDINLQETFVLPENDLAASQAVMCVKPGRYMIVRVLDSVEVPLTDGYSVIDCLTKLVERNDSLVRNANLREHTI